ncbi:chloride channel protein, CIC family [Ekhidna lutea]|uniref:Chloride channel protein, CIC family n=1 Tax=Ekhidna lutea TaxID=447679 RepID=A0A239F8T6_EKHLU|nr:chloride channel protein [Ekhidna lutea]SNS52494.1 chloride channel protein, CIC family [Ekhidna lutea]
MANQSKGTFSTVMMKFLVWRIKHISDNNFLLITAGLIGLFSGLAAVILKSAVHAIIHYLELNLNLFGFNYLYLGYPLVGILLTVFVAKYLFKESLGHGITQILYSISKNSSIMRRTRMYSRMVTSAITVGFGGSVGLEAPIVVTGSAIGSNLAKLFHLGYKNRTVLLGCGAAGAISAIFNSPVTGVIFAMEVILTEVKISRFIPLLIASVCGQLVALVLLGEDILFSFKLTESFIAGETGYYLIFGAACGLISLYFTRIMYVFEGGIKKLKNDFGRAAVGGLSLALIILTFPPIYGEGYDTIKSLLVGNTADVFHHSFLYEFSEYQASIIIFLILILLVKPMATALTIGAGGSGGIFAPSLFMGGLSGFVFSTTSNSLLNTSLSTSNFTLVGMCGVMSGVLHAPLTAIFLIAEITSGYELFVPLMLVSAISFSTISYFEKHSIYTKRLIETGDLIQYDKDQIVLSLIDLKKIVEKDLLIIHPEATLNDLVSLVMKSKRNIFPVVNDQKELEGIVTLDDIREMMFDDESRQNVIVKTIMQKPPARVSPQEKMQSVMNKFEVTQAWNLPVIDNGKYVGFISKSRIFNAYRKKLIRQTAE